MLTNAGQPGRRSGQSSVLVALAMVVLACSSRVGADGASPTTAPSSGGSTSLSPSPTALVAVAGACTTAGSATRVVLEHLFALTTSGDARQVADCYASAYRDAHPTFAGAADAWTHAGPATVESVRFVDRVNDCDRFEIVAQLAHGESIGWQGRQRVFYSLGLESGVPRVFDSGSALAAPEVTRVACR